MNTTHRLTWTAALLLITISWLGTALPANAAQETSTPSHEIIPCPMNLPEGDVDGETIVCGQLSVPENWEMPGENTVTITYAILKAKSGSPFGEPILYLEGGPGGSALEDIEKLSGYFSKLRETRDFIYYDQRGTAYSSNLECPSVIQAKPITDEMQQADEAEASADEEAGADDASEQTTEEEPSDTEPFPTMAPFIDRDTQEVLDQLRAMGSPGETACYDYFQSEGVDLTQYNTTNSIHDLMALMQALDYDLYNIYGISYGSRLALELLRAYGDTEAGADLPAIRSIAIDGIDPPHIDSVTQSPLATMYITLRLLSDCEAEDACGAAYPDIRGRALELLAQAKDTPLEIAGSEGTTQTVTLDNLSSLLTGATVTDEEDFKHIGYEEIVPYLPALVDELSRGIGDTYIGLKQGILPLEPDAEGPENASIFDPLALRSQKLSDDAQTLAAELAVLSAQAQRSSGALDGEESLPEFFTRELVHLANEQSSFEGLGGFGRLIFQTFATQEPNRETLAAIIDFLELDEVGQATLNGIVSLMDDEQVVATVELVVTDRVLEQLIQALQIQMNTAVTCNDLYGQFDAVSAVEDYRNLEAPSLLLDPALLITYIARCERYQLTAGAGESTEPVVRDDDIPILIVNGSIDATTPAEWGMATAENLPGAQLVTIPMLDHGATAKSACGQDIVRFFFTYPDQEVNDDCIEALKPVFVLPDDQ